MNRGQGTGVRGQGKGNTSLLRFYLLHLKPGTLLPKFLCPVACILIFSALYPVSSQDKYSLSTPKQAFLSLKEAMESGDFEAVYDFLSVQEQKKLDMEIEKLKGSMGSSNFRKEDIEWAKIYGIKEEQLKNLKGRDGLRISFFMFQVFMEAFKSKRKVNVMDEARKAFKDAVYVKDRKGESKGIVFVVFQAKKETIEVPYIYENNLWKIQAVNRLPFINLDLQSCLPNP